MIRADIEALTSLFSDRLVWTHSSASKDNKAALLAKIASGKTQYVTMKRSDEHYIASDASFVATGVVEMDVKLDGAPRQMRSRYLNVWFNEGDAWRVVAWQSTPIAH
jgi:hypothetical protein